MKETNSYALFLMKIEILAIFFCFSIVKTIEITKPVNKDVKRKVSDPKI